MVRQNIRPAGGTRLPDVERLRLSRHISGVLRKRLEAPRAGTRTARSALEVSRREGAPCGKCRVPGGGGADQGIDEWAGHRLISRYGGRTRPPPLRGVCFVWAHNIDLHLVLGQTRPPPVVLRPRADAL